MNVGTNVSEQAEPHLSPGRTVQIGRLVRVIVVIAAVALLMSGAVVIQGWIPAWPRSVRRGLTEGLLRAVLAGYVTLFLVSAVGAPLLAVLLFKSRRARRSRPHLARALLLAASCSFSLVLLELGSTGWRLWMHRFPKLPTSFPAAPTDEFRIVVLGGSSALGEPYRPWLSVGQIVAWRLGGAMPGRPIECEILAWLGDSLEDQHRKLAALKQRPSMVIIYSGHNEFTARFEEEREGWLDEEPGNRLIRLVYRASLNSPFCRLAYETISKNRLDVGPSMHGRHQLIDSPQCSPAEAAGIGRDFEARLEAITAYCEQIGAVPVLIIPPANEADFEPSRSTLPAYVSQAERTLLEREFRTARESKASDPLVAADLYRKILYRHPRFAEAHFRLARLEEAAGNREAAAVHYLDALENDGLPVRCPARLRGAYRGVAARHASCVLVDGRAELAAESPRRLLDDHVIQDTHHPTFRGQVALARAVLRELDRKNVVGLSSGASSPFDVADCARHFGMDAEKWATMCDRTSEHYRRVAGYRYDPAERLEKSRRYAEAARRIRSGVEPERAGIPGLAAEEEAARQRAPGSAAGSGARVANRKDGGTGAASERPGARPAPSSSGDPLDLPILEEDRCAAAQESYGRCEVIPIGAFNHFPHEAAERTGHDAHRGADRDRGLWRDNEARVDHGVNLLEVSSQSLLIGNVQDGHQPVSPERDEPIFVLPFQEHVAGKEGNDRLDSPALRRAAFLSCLGQVIGDARIAQLARDCLFLARPGVQAPPH